ncbi:MAG: hypothetical protein M0T73_01450 [Deltaproteobacteria bacterium]|nr:hypothetical protein [Deltaproteobacteria bacterium]
MNRAIISVLWFFVFGGFACAENLNCRIVLRDMYAGDSQKTQNLLVPMLKNNELDGVTKLLSSGEVTLFEAGEKVFRIETSVWGYDKVTRPGETKTWLLSPRNSRPCGPE